MSRHPHTHVLAMAAVLAGAWLAACQHETPAAPADALSAERREADLALIESPRGLAPLNDRDAADDLANAFERGRSRDH